MAKRNFEVLGVSDAVSELNKRISKVKLYTPQAMRDIGQDLLGKSVERAPVDEGDLRGSGFSEVDGLTTTVGFTAVYALRQHEETQYNHPQGGEAKYLENPMNENMSRYVKYLEDSTKRAVD